MIIYHPSVFLELEIWEWLGWALLTPALPNGAAQCQLATGGRTSFQGGSFTGLPNRGWPGALFPSQGSTGVSLSPQSKQPPRLRQNHQCLLSQPGSHTLSFLPSATAQAVTMVPSGSRGGDTDLTPPSQWSSDKTGFNKTMWDGVCLDAAIFGKYICYAK